MISVRSSSLRRMAAAVYARRYGVACVCLLVVAGALRFYNLSGAALRYDEAAVALISRGSLSDVVELTRSTHHIPILYPLALWAVQNVGSAEFSVRLISAWASVLTVWALLFVMPRVGVPRGAAFMAGLLAALSAAAIEHAQDAREYSVDALAAVALIAGLLQYLRDGKRMLLCGALVVGPLLQYGLVLFGVAVIAAAAVAPGGSWQAVGGLAARGLGWRWRAAAVWARLRGRVGLLLPLGCFVAACAASWGVTLRYQFAYDRAGAPAFADYYYQGGLDAAAMAEFAVSRVWWMLSYHMPPVVAAGALGAAAAVGALWLMRRRRVDALGLLAVFAVGAAICAALAGAYPLGGIRHNLYLGPIVFLASGMAFHWAAVELASGKAFHRAAPALGIAAVAAIAVSGGASIYQYRDYLYYSDPSVKRALGALDERARAGDVVYVSRWEVPAVEFYKGERPANYFYGNAVCWGASWGDCAPEMLDEMFGAAGGASRIWLLHNASVSVRDAVAAYSQDVVVEEVDVGGGSALDRRRAAGLPAPHYDRQVARLIGLGNDNSWPRPRATLHLITGHRGLAADIRGEMLAMWMDAASGEPSAAGVYDLYLRDDALYYARRPCAAGDAAATFFLHLYPSDAADLPDRRRERGFDNLDFEFREYGLIGDGGCVIRRELPGYAIERVHTGQFVGDDVVWEAEIWVER